VFKIEHHAHTVYVPLSYNSPSKQRLFPNTVLTVLNVQWGICVFTVR